MSVDRARPVVLLAQEGTSTNIVYNALSALVGDVPVLIEESVGMRRFVRARVRTLGPITVAGQILFMGLVPPLLRLFSQRRLATIAREHGLRDEPIPEHVMVRVPSANSDHACDVLRSLAPRVVVVNGTRILSSGTIGSVPAPFLNIHAGLTPGYRGVHGGYWALRQGDRDHFGATVHLVDAGVDTGPVVGQISIRPTAEDNFVTYPLLQLAGGLPILLEAVAAAQPKRSQPAEDRPSRQWYHPTLWRYLTGLVGHGVR